MNIDGLTRWQQCKALVFMVFLLVRSELSKLKEKAWNWFIKTRLFKPTAIIVLFGAVLVGLVYKATLALFALAKGGKS